MNNKNKGLGVRILVLVAGLLAVSAHAQLANNLAIDVKAMSMGHAVTADPPGVMSIHFNPAGLARLDGRRVDLQFVGADFSLESEFSAPPDYNVFGFSDDPVVCDDVPDDGVDFCRNFKTATSSVEGISLYIPFINDTVDLPPGPLIAGPLPAFSIRPAGSKFTFGTATYLPMAAGFYRDEDDVGNYMGERVALERITYLSPSVAYQVNDELSIGASIGMSYQAIALEQDFRAPNELLGFARVIDESICAPFAGESNIALDLILFGICNPDEGLGPFKNLASLEVSMDQRFSPSYNLGVLWEPNDRFAWGAVWRSEAKTHMKGDYKISYSNATQETVNGIGSSATGALALAVLGIPSRIGSEEVGAVSMDLTMPATFQTGIKIKPTERLQFNVDAVWADYKEWDAFNIVFDRSSAVLSLARLFSPGSTSTQLSYPLNFQSTWNLAFGAAYDLTGRIQLRAGYEPRASAIPEDRRSPMVPINEARYYSLGVGYKWDTDTDIDLGIGMLHSKDEIPADTSCAANCTGIDNVVYNPYAGLDIKTEARIMMVGLAFRTKF
ncbi:long-chain fatty acid ABC transporter [Alcanivorax sp. VBW004]|uniref:OmpP1/FadL family transporter n=2 Tax=Gammaproteobacteria TaxID=1236 RepID=UPI0012BC2F1A|nr:outer membrane protein transport protein [Alcanivorax sp. VBW004]MTT53413.1 long-chain fatty acid ABC transporter [Alcanivorax sp. VBW004]